LMIGRDGDEACDKRIRCGRHGRRDAGASSDQDPGAICSRTNVNDGVNGDGDAIDVDNDDDDDNDDDNDDDKYEHERAQL